MFRLTTVGIIAVGAFPGAVCAQQAPAHPAPIFSILASNVGEVFDDTDWWAEAKRRHLEGRVLVGFKIDAQGNTFEQAVVQSEADDVLEKAALDAVQHIHYDLNSLKNEPSLKVDPQTTYFMTIIYCLGHCERFSSFPNTDTSVGFDDEEKEALPLTAPMTIRSRPKAAGQQ